MDSTFFHQLPTMVTTLGAQARFVLVWYFLLKFGIQILWAGVVLLVVHRALGLAKFGFQGTRLHRVLKAAAGTEYPKEQHYVAAETAIMEALRIKK